MDGVADRRFWSFSFVSMVTLERQDTVPTLERGNDQNINNAQQQGRLLPAIAVQLLGKSALYPCLGAEHDCRPMSYTVVEQGEPALAVEVPNRCEQRVGVV